VIRLERSLPVNPSGPSGPGDIHPRLTRAELWRGLVLKAENALPFVPQMTYCKVVERDSATRFVRDVEFRGDKMRERVELIPGQQVTFTRLAGPVLGTIHNCIDEDQDGLRLRFAFALELTDVEPDSPYEREYAASMEQAYLGAVDATLAAIRKLHAEEGP
jgi:hypothetical protein